MIALLIYLLVGYFGIAGAVYLLLRATKRYHGMHHYQVEEWTFRWPLYLGFGIIVTPFMLIGYGFVCMGDKLEERFSK
jgi:hypothetical protein